MRATGRLPTGALVVVPMRSTGEPVWEGKWRYQGRQVKRRLGAAWLAWDGSGWAKRRGRTGDGYMSEADATVAMRGEIARWFAAQEQQREAESRPTVVTFADAALSWYERAKRRNRKVATINDYRYVLNGYLLPPTITIADEHRNRSSSDGSSNESRSTVEAPTNGRDKTAAPTNVPDDRGTPDSDLPMIPAAISGSSQHSGNGSGNAVVDRTVDAGKALGRRRKLQISPPPFALEEVSTITPADLRRWFDSIPYGRTKEKLTMIVRSIFRHAEAMSWIDSNPALEVDLDAIRYDGNRDIYTVGEVEKLISAAASESDAALFTCAALSGLRRGEILALRWRDIDFAHAKIIVRGNVSFGVLVTPKSNKSRVVPMVPALAARLRDLKPADAKTADFVFVGSTGGFLDASAVRRRYAKAVRNAGLRHLPFHGLRHFFCSQSVQVASLPQVRAWAGHADVRTTARYLHAKSRTSDAKLLATAFASAETDD